MNAKYLLTILSSLFVVSLVAQKQVLPDFHADPSAKVWDGKYWIYPSTDEPGSTSWKEMRRWHCYSSDDLATWENEGEIFSLEKISWASHSAFAPDAVKRNGKYYFFFPAEFQIGVAVAPSPTGPFEDAIGVPLLNSESCPGGVNAYDPCIFIDDDEAQTPYLYYGGGRLAVVKLKDNLIETDGEVQRLYAKEYHEGIWVHKYRGTYYLSYPNFYRDDEGNIKQLLVYSTAPTPTGPFTFQGAFLDNKSRNSHHSIVEIKGQWYLFYHIQGPSAYERRVCIEYLYYNEDGTIKPIEMTKDGVEPI